jgi:hypothetical protein
LTQVSFWQKEGDRPRTFLGGEGVQEDTRRQKRRERGEKETHKGLWEALRKKKN